MFYPEFSPAMKWQLHNPRIYSNFVFPNCGKQFQDETDQSFGKFGLSLLFYQEDILINVYDEKVLVSSKFIMKTNYCQPQLSFVWLWS